MPGPELLDRVRHAIESQDLDAFAALLAPEVTWGAPGDPNPACRNRRQVLQWYRRGFDRGVRAAVLDVIPLGESVLVGLGVTGNLPPEGSGGQVERWLVLAFDDGLVSDIRGFEDRASALADAGRASG